MKYATVASGISAESRAWTPLGWEPQWFAENAPFPSAVLAHHYPHVPNLGDMTKLDEHETYRESVIDVFAGGTPCQGLSIAGKRGGLDDPRSGLALRFLDIAGRKRPRWVVWENVPDTLSSNGGRDFGAIIGGLVQRGYGVAWRVLDAQYAGLAQRRRRLFVVGYLGDWRPAAAVLFERHGLQGNPPPSRKKGKNITPDAACCATASRNRWNGSAIDGMCFIVSEVASCLTANAHKGGQSTAGNNPGMVNPVICFQPRIARNGRGKLENIAPALTGSNAGATSDMRPCVVQPNLAVRRLTPIEYERLQGFPDDYTRIPYRGKTAEKCPDGPRYQALGNSIPVPVLEWIGRRIELVEKLKSLTAALAAQNTTA